jgi:phospholipid/cholesterol/gamma-HCH transport system substrate-binding protein
VRRFAVAVVSLIAAVVLPSCGSGDDDSYRLTATFPKAVSLYEASTVRVLGLAAGTVEDVEVAGTEVKVTMRINGDIPIPADVNATIVPVSLIGERYVQLFPAWTEGQPRAEDGDVIPPARTTIPVEPDEALEAVKEFLDTLDPDATGRLVRNAAEDLEGNGESLNRALEGISELTTTFAEKDEELVEIIDHFDDFTATLRTREGQLGKVMDGFAQTTSLLAQERRAIEQLVSSLADLSQVGLDLVSEHAGRLERDIAILTRTLKSVETNLDTVLALLDSGPVLVAGRDLDGKGEGLLAAWDPKYHHLDLRTSVTPTLAVLFRTLGLDPLTVCVPVDVVCQPQATATRRPQASSPGPPAQIPGGPGQPAIPGVTPPAPAGSTTSSTTPIDGVVDLLGSSLDGFKPRAAVSRPGGGGWFLRAARSLVDVVT